jgi:hypothetical protein
MAGPLPIKPGADGLSEGGGRSPTLGTCADPAGSRASAAWDRVERSDPRPKLDRTPPPTDGGDRTTRWPAEPRARRPLGQTAAPPARHAPASRSATGALGLAHTRTRRFRQRRVTFAGPQLPSTSTARTRTATFAVRLRTGRTIPAVGVWSVAIFHGPLFTEYWTL